jgi:hypothetical protein
LAKNPYKNNTIAIPRETLYLEVTTDAVVKDGFGHVGVEGRQRVVKQVHVRIGVDSARNGQLHRNKHPVKGSEKQGQRIGVR